MKSKYIIFTDLDGTLLDHHTYSFEEAIPALNFIKKQNIPLILVSSKTRIELLHIRKQLDLKGSPFVVENGSAIYTNLDYFDSIANGEKQDDLCCYRLGKSFHEIKNTLENISKEYNYCIKGYHNATPEQISEITALSGDSLIRSLYREFSIPLFYDARAEDILIKEVHKYDLQILYGGRFMHLLSNIDKGNALKLIMQGYKNKFKAEQLKSLALGDSLNDFSMLAQSDIPVLVKRFDGTYESRQRLENVYYCKDIGPRGWNQFLIDFLSQGGKNE
jgi:mannosyl-3-phosphoglycerate phosphatase